MASVIEWSILMHYRRRLRSRIIFSFALFGLALTALFAVSAIYLRQYLEDKLIGEVLQKNLQDYADKFYIDPRAPGVPLETVQGYTYSSEKIANVQFSWRDLPNGVHDLHEPDGVGGRRVYKLAVRKDPDTWFFLKYDTAQERRSQKLLQAALIIVVVIFSLLSLAIGFWSSARVMRPVADLARRVRGLGKIGRPEALSPHFADDEVGQLAAALDDYSNKLTALVIRDREFNADVSHELRTPLAVIASTTELLLATPDLPIKAQERLKRVERAVRQCSETIDALLVLSRSERQLPSDGESTEVSTIVEQIIEVNRQHIANKSVVVQLRRTSAVEVAAPSAVVAVVIGNLVGNAFKYTTEGEVFIHVGEGKVLIEDSGRGIEHENPEKLFERGYRASSTPGKGAGLGLAIVRRLCDLYGWKVSLLPRPQGGTLATLIFQL